MKRVLFVSLLLTILFSFETGQFATRYVCFAGASTNFNQLDSVAKSISGKTKITYQNNLVYDSKRGMIVPDTSSDKIYAGHYFPRRDAEERISIEMVSYYKNGDLSAVDGSNKMMCIVTAVFGSKKEADLHLKKIKPIVKDAYCKKVNVYIGCMH
jgi:hypothetical protein